MVDMMIRDGIEELCYGSCPMLQLFILENSRNGVLVETVDGPFLDECANYYRSNFENCSVVPTDPYLTRAQRVLFDYYIYEICSGRGIGVLDALVYYANDLESFLSDCGAAGRHVWQHFEAKLQGYIDSPEEQQAKVRVMTDRIWDRTGPTYDPFTGGWCLIDLTGTGF